MTTSIDWEAQAERIRQEEYHADETASRICSYVDLHTKEYQQIALAIHERPEVSNYEFFASKILSEKLKEAGFTIELPAAGHRTGFSGVYRSLKPGPVIVFLAEYDALEGLGHGCGHNLFGAMSALAGAALATAVDETGGEVRVYGTPGEEGGENGSAKGSFVREGYFTDVSAALCAHPGDHHGVTGKSLGCVPIEIEFHGKASHAASAPEKGINALDALLLTYSAINALRQQLTDDVRIHGIITHGGTAPNVIPEYAAAKFYLRAAAKPTLEDVYQKVEKIVQGAALQTGCTGSMHMYQNWVENEVPTPLFDAVYEKSLRFLGEVMDRHSIESSGSSDVGNVTQVVPCIQPTIRISDYPIPAHSAVMVEAARSKRGLEAVTIGAKALGLTALELLRNPDLLDSIRRQHAMNVQNQ